MSSTVQNKHIRKLKKTVLILLGIYVMIATLLYFIQERMLFHPTVLAMDYTYQFSQPFEEVFLKTEDEAVINAIHFKSRKPKGVILYFHGNAGDLSRWGIIAEFFVEQNYDVFIMDYRSYGKSTGMLSEQALYEDAQLCYDHLLNEYQESHIIIYGRSLGTGIGAHLASNNEPKQLILETPFYSMTDVASYRFPFFPVRYLLKYQFPTYQFLNEVKCPIAIFHGTDDGVVPFESGKKLFETLPPGQGTFVQIDGGNHNNLIEFEKYITEINSILK